MPRSVLALVVFILFVVPAWRAEADEDLPSLAVPGGVSSFAQAVGVSQDLPRARLLLTAVRILWEVSEGMDPAADRRRAAVLEYLRGLDLQPAAETPAAADAVPGFLPAPVWSRVLQDVGATGASPFTAILRHRRAALFYHGVASLDPRTREYLAAHPALLEQVLGEDRVALFATFGRSLRVSGDRILTPGGNEAVPLWEAVTGAPVGSPAAFIPLVLDRDGGRLALLYDGIAHLDESARRFALGLHLPRDERVDRFKAFYGAAGDALQTWQPRRRPFARVPFDAIHLLLSTRFEPDGRLAGPAWPALWKAVFDPTFVPGTSELDPKDFEEADRCDAARMVGLVSVGDPVERERRSRVWLLAHRLFRQPAAGSVPDLILTLKGVASYPSLFVTLERMGIEALPTYVAAVRAAGRLPGADRRLWLFQGALSVLERARSARAVDAAAADTLVRALCAVTPANGDPYRGAVARWLDRDLLAAAGPPVLPPDLAATDRPIETHLLAAMAGSVASRANTSLLALPLVRWEGLAYRVDPGGSALRRLAQVRARQGGRSLDAVLGLLHRADAIAAAGSSEEAAIAARELPAAAAALREPGAEGQRPPAVADDEPDLDGLIRRASDRVKKLKARDPRSAAGIAQPLLEAVDSYLTGVLGAIVYAPYLGEPDGPALLAGDPSRVHDFRFFEPRKELGRRTAWELPVEVRGQKVAWGVSGSLLGLETAIGRLSLRRAFTETFPSPPTLSDAERQTFTEAALLASALDVNDAGDEALLASLARGRQRVEALGSTADEIGRLAADVELDEWRTQALSWTIARDPGRRLDLFSLAELARAGGLAPAGGRLDAWGTSGFARDGDLAARYPVHLSWTTIGGRRGVRAVAALVPDLAIGLAESLRRLELPAALTPGLLLVATQRFIETVQTAHPDDWLAMVSHARAVARDGVEDYVAALTVSGPLVPERE